jgi:NAD(P)-dependent dehydrogenase (short-subunit alcohol dehydrogenase family)
MAVSAQAEIPSQLGRSAVVTGATGGLGYETALGVGQGRGRGHCDRPRQSEGAVCDREDQS